MLKNLNRQLAAIGELVSYKDHLAHLLKGFPAEYDSFVLAVYNWVDNPTVEEVQSLLVLYDLQLEKRNMIENLILLEANSASMDSSQSHGLSL